MKTDVRLARPRGAELHEPPFVLQKMGRRFREQGYSMGPGFTDRRLEYYASTAFSAAKTGAKSAAMAVQRVPADFGPADSAWTSWFIRPSCFARNGMSPNGSPPRRAQYTRPCLSIRLVECSSISSKSS